MDMKLIFVLIFVAVCLVILVTHAQDALRRRALNRRLSSLVAKDVELWQYYLHKYTKYLATSKDRVDIVKTMRAAGFDEIWYIDAFFLAKTLLVLFAIFYGWFFFELSFSTLLANPFDLLQYFFVLFLASRFLDWIITDKMKRRQEKIRNTVPKAIDLLTICVDSGLSLEDSFERVAKEIEYYSPEIASEFRTTRSEMLVMNRMDSLKRMEKRSGVRELESLAAALLQSIKYGTALASSLRLIAKESRAKQVSNLEEKAGKISASIGIPLILLILLPLVGIIAAPAVISLMNTF